MSDNSFQAFYEELKMLVEKFEKKQMQIKMESDLDYDSVKIFGEITKTILEKWHDEITPEQLEEMKWNLKEIQNTLSNIESKFKK